MKYLIADLTCRSYPYDTHLYDALQRRCENGTLRVAGCLDEQVGGGYSDFREGLIDWAGQLPLASGSLRRYLKAAEYVANVFLLLRRIYRERPDVLHIQWLPLAEAWVEFELWWVRQVQRLGTSVVYTAHNVLPHDTGDRFADQFRAIYQSVDAVICHTRDAREQLRRRFGVAEETVYEIPHGPLFTEVTSLSIREAKQALDFDQQAPLCVMFGRLKPYKGTEFLLRAWKQVADEQPDAVLVLAGKPDSAYEARLHALIDRLGVEAFVRTRFYFLPQRELSRVVSAADVLVYPYREVTQSGALLTGMAAGKAIVATDTGGLGEVLTDGETGRLVPYGNVDTLGRVLANLLNDSDEQEALGERARRVAHSKYSWDAIAQKTVDCYRVVGYERTEGSAANR